MLPCIRGRTGICGPGCRGQFSVCETDLSHMGGCVTDLSGMGGCVTDLSFTGG